MEKLLLYRHASSAQTHAGQVNLLWCCSVIEQHGLNENISVAIQMRSFSGNACTNSHSMCRQSSDSTSHDCFTAGDLSDMYNHLSYQTHVMVLCTTWEILLRIGRGLSMIYLPCSGN